jgi:endonuclease/exonuclease/phosphatase (EEP) superfamily protein YafD
MLSALAQLTIIAAALWAIVDAIFNLEHSWLLFVHRVVSPILLVTALGASCASLVSRRKNLSARLLLFQFLIVSACAAPIVRSLKWSSVATSRPPTSSPATTLRLFNANILGYKDLSQQVISEIKAQEPDVITLQEVNPELADKLSSQLRNRYPCQRLAPQQGSWGMGTLAKFPCIQLPLDNPGIWVGAPQLVMLDLPTGGELLVANLHAIHPHVALERESIPTGIFGLTATVKNREASIRSLLTQLSATSATATIIAGDLNASMRNLVYEDIRRAGYHDTWLALHPLSTGGTWPYPGLGGIPLLAGLFRIDFIFHSHALRPKRIELLPESLGSDHRGLISEFEVYGVARTAPQ